MPDCRQDKFRNWYPFTFCVSMVWISFYSYFMVWMITIIGKKQQRWRWSWKAWRYKYNLSNPFLASIIFQRQIQCFAGSTLGIPDTVMGLTFVAAGVSVPDALSSLAVIKEGLGDMAVSNAVGSNVFDILVCLGLPWFIQTAMIQPGSHVNVTSRGKIVRFPLYEPCRIRLLDCEWRVWELSCISIFHKCINVRSLEVTKRNSNSRYFIVALPGLTYSTVSLLSTVVFLVLATHLNGWKLDRRYGAILMVWYLVFITFASLYELNVFGEMNPPVCFSAF